jgi:hypothetical protein
MLVPRHVIDVGVRDEGPWLAATKIDRQVRSRQLQSAVEMKHKEFQPV